MAKSSSRPRPGDSAPDFSHLSEVIPDSDDAPWMPAAPPDEQPTADAAADATDEPLPQQPERVDRDDAADVLDDHADDPTADASHIFFDVDERLGDDPAALAGETVAMPGRDVDLLPDIDPTAPSRSCVPIEHQSDAEVPDTAADNADEDNSHEDELPLETLPTNILLSASELTDVGMPAFEPIEDQADPAPASDEAVVGGDPPVDADEEAEGPIFSFIDASQADAPLDDDAAVHFDPLAGHDDREMEPLDLNTFGIDNTEGPGEVGSTRDLEDWEPQFPGPPENDAIAVEESAAVAVDDAAQPVASTVESSPAAAGITTTPALASPDSTERLDDEARGAASTRPVAGRASAARSAAPQATTSVGDGPRQRLTLILLGSYASAVTLAWVWLWLASQNARPHELESLPDVAPLNANEFRYAPQSASMPRGHTLPLGTAQQLGAIRVEPLRVSRGVVEFTHYSAAGSTRPATAPVLKLWLRFTNVSDDQLIAPLDSKLLFTRKYNDLGETELANQIVFPAERKASGGSLAFMIEHPETSEWDLKGQQLGYRLKPGESLETYLPTQPGSADNLTGDLLWRVHFRKGYHAPTGHGVTTMIEVPFRETDISDEA